MIEIKNVLRLDLTDQIRTQIIASKQEGLIYKLITSDRLENIAQLLRDAIDGHGSAAIWKFMARHGDWNKSIHETASVHEYSLH